MIRAILSPRRQLFLILLLWGAGLGAAGQFAKFSVILPEVAAYYPARGASIGFIVSLVSCTGLVLGLMTGVMLNRVSARHVLVLSLLLGSSISFFQMLLPSFPVMLASRVLEGLSHLGIVVAAPTLIASIASKRHVSLAMSLWATFFGLSFALTAWLGLPLVKEFGIEALFLVHAIYMAMMAIVLSSLLPATTKPAAPAAEEHNRPFVQEFLHRHRQAYSSPFIAAPSCGWLFYTATFVALLTVMPTLLPNDERALVAGLMPLASIAASMTLGVYLLKFMQAMHVVAIGFILAILAALTFTLMPTEPWVPIALASSLGLVQGASYAAIPQLNANTSDQAIAYGSMAQTGNLGNIIGTPLLLGLLAVSNPQTMMAVVILLYLCAIALHILLGKARTRRSATMA